MSAIVGRVIHERRERAKSVGRRRPPIAAAAAAEADKTPGAATAATSDSCAVEAAVAAAVELEVDERLALRRTGGCFLPCLKGAWLCSVLGLALIALGSAMCFFAFHSDVYSRLPASSSASARPAAASPSSFSDYESAASEAAAAAEHASEVAAAAAVVATAANELPVSAAAAARSASKPAELDSGGSNWILRSFLKSLSYLGPTVIGVGAFVIVVSCVMILDRRELIVSALKIREAQMNEKNKDTVYAAVVARYMRRRQMGGGGDQRPRSHADDESSPAATHRPYTFLASAIRQLHDCSDAIALRGAVVDGEDRGGRGLHRRSSTCSGGGGGGGQPRADDDDRSSAAAVGPTAQPLDVLGPMASLNAAAAVAGTGCYASSGEARADAETSAVTPDRYTSSVPLRNGGAAVATHVGLNNRFGSAALVESPSGPPAYSSIVVSTVFDAKPEHADTLPPDQRPSLGFRGGATQHAVAVSSV